MYFSDSSFVAGIPICPWCQQHSKKFLMLLNKTLWTFSPEYTGTHLSIDSLLLDPRASLLLLKITMLSDTHRSCPKGAL